MIRKLFFFALVIIVFTGTQSLLADDHLTYYQFAEGDWELEGNRLYQNNIDAALAKVNIKIPQQGIMKYSFNVRYEGGMRDLKPFFL